MYTHTHARTHTWKEWAPIGPGGAAVSIVYRKFHHVLYEGLGQLLDEKTLDQCPTFFDTAGFSANDRVPEAKLLSTIASGRLPENTDLREILTPHFNHKEWLSSLTQNKELQCWSILLVVRADKDFSREIAKVCYQAWEILEKSLNGKRPIYI